MTGFFRSLSQRFRKQNSIEENLKTTQATSKQSTSKLSAVPEINSRKDIQCKVLLLDSTNFSVIVSVLFFIRKH